ncbi:MAG: hypothetical protein JW937_06460, partial [Candidatus Omnitrophica bacterium]|nr:hypothetical protein [Candidatus Omnitrophota bacterium]
MRKILNPRFLGFLSVFFLVVASAAFAQEVNWEFETQGDFEGWYPSMLGAAVVENGALSGTVSGLDPKVFSAKNLGIAAQDVNVLRFGYTLTDPSPGTSRTDILQVQWVTETSPRYGGGKWFEVPVMIDGRYHEVVYDLGSHPQWDGVITRLRIDPIKKPALGEQASIHHIRLVAGVAPREDGCVVWEWEAEGDAEGWTRIRHVSNPLVVSGGALRGDILASDPGIRGPILSEIMHTSFRSPMGSEIPSMVLEYQISSANRLMEVYWSTEEFYTEGEEGQRTEFSIIPDGARRVIELNLGRNAAWRDRRIRRLRIDPVKVGAAGESFSFHTVALCSASPVSLSKSIWQFEGDTEGWQRLGSTSGLESISGNLVGTILAKDPRILGPSGLSLQAADLQTVQIDYNISGVLPVNNTIQFFWTTDAEPFIGSGKYAEAPVICDGTNRSVNVDPAVNPKWTGTVQSLRLDPVKYGDTGEFKFDTISIIPDQGLRASIGLRPARQLHSFLWNPEDLADRDAFVQDLYLQGIGVLHMYYGNIRNGNFAAEEATDIVNRCHAKGIQVYASHGEPF